jgi:carboxypeptidase Taq
MTTRFDPDNPLDALFSSIHETGHGLYDQGLPLEHRHNPLGWAVGMAVHESQSRLWENQVGRSAAFWTYFEPLFRQAFPSQLSGISSDDLYLAINAVHRNPIRVDADEVTYNLHIMLRFELEKALFDGSLQVKDLPDEWNRLSGEILGLTPKNDAEGVLQDIHWAYGSFGYFPSYCLGNMMAAQLWYKVLEEIPGLPENFARGDFSTLLDWLRSQVHRHGKRYDTDELVLKGTGQPLSPHSLLRYLRERYLPLYSS